MGFEIREMERGDWDDVKSIYRKCPEYAVWDTGHLKDCRYVALADGKVIGFCALSPTSVREPYRGVVELSVYFDRRYRGMGIGTRLVSYLAAESEKKGYWCIFAVVFANNPASINMLKKCGFREIGYREKIAKDKFGVWQDTVLLERRNSIM